MLIAKARLLSALEMPGTILFGKEAQMALSSRISMARTSQMDQETIMRQKAKQGVCPKAQT
jgi:hypothetical protein